jgi:hypothetical protein
VIEPERFYVYVLNTAETAHGGIIRIGMGVPPDATKLYEFPTRQQAEAFAESAAIGFQHAGMMIVYEENDR